MQTVHSALKPQALNGEIGLLNYLLMGWALFGKQLVAFYGLVHPGKSKRDRFNMLLGQATGFLTLPFSIPSRNRLSYELAQWLSKVEHRS
jgi:hypothetical protein